MPDVAFDVIDEGDVVDIVLDDDIIDLGVDDIILSVITVDGPPGQPGPPGDGTPVMGEIPTGVRDGTNPTYTTTHPYRPLTLAVYRNGLREVRGVGFFEAAPNTVTFSTPPLSTDDLTVDYVIS